MNYRYHTDIPLENSEINFQSQGKGSSQIAYICLCVFALLRPIMCIQYFAETSIIGLNFLELFSISISYTLLAVSLLEIHRLRTFPINFATVIGLLFCLYLLFTLVLGSHIRETFRVILPFAIFIAVRVIIKNEKQIITLLSLIFLSYIIPLLGSAWLIMIGESIGKTIYQTGLIRYEGMYLKIHSFAHAMFIFVFVLFFYVTLNKNEKKGKKLFLYCLYFLCFIAIFNLFKSYTRNVWIGLFILLVFYLWGRKKYLVIATCIFGVAIIALVSKDFHTIFFDFIEPLSGEKEIRHLGAGRMGLWTSLIHRFKSLPLEVKLVGIGIESEKQGFGIGRSHNDFLALLYTTGLIGFILYITFLLRVGYDILKSSLERQLKYLFMGFFCSVIFMNIASNSYVTRVELAQYFYFILGLFYVLNDKIHKIK
jgi:O-antigen ligase